MHDGVADPFASVVAGMLAHASDLVLGGTRTYAYMREACEVWPRAGDR